MDAQLYYQLLLTLSNPPRKILRKSRYLNGQLYRASMGNLGGLEGATLEGI